ncbi:MAG: carbohydrate ABC transporter permease [Chloroflexi bacterium]|nr:MAG: carbohydrate ABC transporter permease [Chloroflexota bacterium]MBL1196234.1 carbohydrate ABC transporter permease [Chloroflexota bacterium]NOH13528.1 carbohydrate ABC transporter permease [Chloroflexota bacterium]
MQSSMRLNTLLKNTVVYIVLGLFAGVMVFPFLVMLFTSLKVVEDTYNFPPRLLPRQQITMQVDGFEEPLPLYYVDQDAQRSEYVLIERSVRVANYAEPDDMATTYLREVDQVTPTGGEAAPQTIMVDGEEEELFDIEVDGQIIPMIVESRTALGRFADPNDLNTTVLQNVRLSEPVEKLTYTFDSYQEVTELHAMGRSLSNTALVTIGVVLGQLITSILGGYAFARLRFPGRDKLFVVYLATIMIPFVVLITPLYQLMVTIGWVDRLAALIIPWIFTAYGTFLMRQAFLAIPNEIEEAAILDGASRFQILRRIFLPASTPAIAALATFTFLYAWNSFFWPLVVINSGNESNRVLTLALNVLGGRAADSPNLVLAGAAIAVLPPVLIYILGQRFFVESATSTGLKG